MSYIPNKSDLQYKGEFDASANSPLLSDSNGETGDLYRVTISGVTDFGSGPIELKENDYILFNTNGQWEKFISQNIVKGGKKPIIQLTSTDNDTNINNDTITVISWDNTLIKDNGYGHNTNSNTGQVTINESGRYLVYVSLAYDVNNYRINPRIRFRLNGNILEGEGLTGYVRNASGHNEGSNNLSRIIDVNAGDVLEVITDRIADNGNATLRPNESIFFIQKFQSVVYQTQQIDADTLGGLESTEFAKNGENLILNSKKVTSDYSITNNDYGIYADASNGPITITVPDAELFNGYIFSITKTDNSTNQVFIETISENFTINGNFLMSLKDQFDSATIQSDGNNYYIPYKDDKTSSPEDNDLQGGMIAPDTINIPGGVEAESNIDADNYIFDVFKNGKRTRFINEKASVAFVEQPNSFVVFLTGINYDKVSSKTVRRVFDFNQVSLNPVSEVYDFESGSFGSNWTINNFFILSDVAHTGTYSAGSDGQGSVDATLTPTFAQNGKNIEKIVLYWWEETNQTGHQVRLYDNNNNIILQFETENPQIQIFDGNGIRTLFDTDYRQWVRVESYIFYDSFSHITKFDDGQRQARTFGPLKNEGYGKNLFFRGNNGTHCRFDDIELSYFA